MHQELPRQTETGYPARRRVRARTAIFVLAATSAAVTALAVSLFAGSAGALTAVTATENINTKDVPVGFSGTTLNSLSLSAGSSYAVLGTVGVALTGSAPASIQCRLVLPNEPPDTELADLAPGKGTSVTNLSFMGVTELRAANLTPAPGSATLSCSAISPGADNFVIAHDARVLAIPVDAVKNNVCTLADAGC